MMLKTGTGVWESTNHAQSMKYHQNTPFMIVSYEEGWFGMRLNISLSMEEHITNTVEIETGKRNFAYGTCYV